MNLNCSALKIKWLNEHVLLRLPLGSATTSINFSGQCVPVFPDESNVHIPISTWNAKKQNTPNVTSNFFWGIRLLRYSAVGLKSYRLNCTNDK